MVSNMSKTAWEVCHVLIRSDSCVKNHFYSKMRKSLRRLNKLINEYFKKDYR